MNIAMTLLIKVFQELVIDFIKSYSILNSNLETFASFGGIIANIGY